MSSHAQTQGGSHPRITSAYDEPETPAEVSRRQFMSIATLAVGGIVGLGLVIPIVGSLLPDVSAGGATWTPLDESGWTQLQTATEKPVQINISLHAKDAYLPEEVVPESVWGIKIKDDSKFKAARTDLFSPAGKDLLPYPVVNLGFVIFSSICPHLGCHYMWNDGAGRFMCPCHGSQFAADGTHLAGPAARGLDPLPLRSQSGKAQVEWIRYKPTVPDRLVISYTD